MYVKNIMRIGPERMQSNGELTAIFLACVTVIWRTMHGTLHYNRQSDLMKFQEDLANIMADTADLCITEHKN